VSRTSSTAASSSSTRTVTRPPAVSTERECSTQREALQLFDPLIGDGGDDDEQEAGQDEADNAQSARDQCTHDSSRRERT
jgi:hypothetical protein